MLSLFKKQKNNTAGDQIGIALSPDGIALAKIKLADGAPNLLAFDYQACEHEQQLSTLVSMVEAQHCHHAAVNFVLPTTDYQLLLTKPPEVPDEEMVSAIQWQIKDLISFPVEEAVMSVFRVYQADEKPYNNFIYAAVADKKVIQNYVDLAAGAGLKIHSIDIQEFAVRNLLAINAAEQAAAQVAFLYLGRKGGNISIFGEENLCLSRKITIGFQAFLENDNAELSAESLALEIQRSFDFFESQMRRPPIMKLYLAPLPDSFSDVIELLKGKINAKIQLFDCNEAVSSERHLSLDEQMNVMTALGGSLRSLVLSNGEGAK